MKLNRRNVMSSLVGIIPACALSRAANCQETSFRCTGLVSDEEGNPMEGIEVQLLGRRGRIGTTETDADGSYDLETPGDDPYVLVFREPSTNTRLLLVELLTGGTNQAVSVTVQSGIPTIHSAYQRLQAVESLAAWAVVNYPPPDESPMIVVNELKESVELLQISIEEMSFPRLPAEVGESQRENLFRKVAAINSFLDSVSDLLNPQ